jgi:DNA-binding protein HU-beta
MPALSCRPICGGLRRFYGSQIGSTTLMALKKPAPAAAKTTAKAPAAKSAAPAAKAKVAAPKQATISLKQVAAELADAHELERGDAEALLSGMIEVLVAHLRKGDRLRLTGLGILQVRDTPARAGRNPATGEQIQIAAKRKIVFRPATDLKQALIG